MLSATKAPKWGNIAEIAARVGAIRPGSLIIAFDTETTGLREDSKIIQFSGVKCLVNSDMTLSQKDTINLYINPEEKLSDKIIEITGITQEMVDSAQNENFLSDEIFQWLTSSFPEDDQPRQAFWAAYNARFDITKLRYMAMRTGVRFPDAPTEDILVWARKMLANEIPSFSLGDVYAYLFPEKEKHFHNSLEDTKAMTEIIEALMKRAIDYRPPEKRLVQLEKAAPFINRYNHDQRIRLQLSEGDFGDIFYDVRRKVWSCCAKTKAKKRFEAIDMQDVEEQYIQKYGWKLGNPSVEAVAKGQIDWLKKLKGR
jgi:DNA polymerase III epsilon subunit-like protein